MTDFTYTAFVQLGSSSEKDRITTDVTIQLTEQEVERLTALKASHQGRSDKISQTVKTHAGALHHKLMRGAYDDIACLLTENAVENRYTEVYEEDLFAQDCDSGRFTPSADEDAPAALLRWRQEEARRLAAMSRTDRTAYLATRYLIELDFDETDYDYTL